MSWSWFSCGEPSPPPVFILWLVCCTCTPPSRPFWVSGTRRINSDWFREGHMTLAKPVNSNQSWSSYHCPGLECWEVLSWAAVVIHNGRTLSEDRIRIEEVKPRDGERKTRFTYHCLKCAYSEFCKWANKFSFA